MKWNSQESSPLPFDHKTDVPASALTWHIQPSVGTEKMPMKVIIVVIIVDILIRECLVWFAEFRLGSFTRR